MKTILKLLDIKNGTKEYNRIFQFTEPIISSHNIAANYSYTNLILGKIRKLVLKGNMNFEFPKLIVTRNMETSKMSNNDDQLSMIDYM